jgi:predicted phage-related endonuclease
MIERIEISDRASWLELRRADITASDVAIVCGEGLYGSMAELYAEKKGLRPPLVDNGVLKRGRWGEATVFEALLDERPAWDIRRAKIYLRDPDLRLGATPDGFAIAPDHDGIGVIQAKVISRSSFIDHWLINPKDSIKYGDAVPPEAYRLQTITEQMLATAKWGYLAVVINSEWDWDCRLFPVERDEVIEDRIRYNVAEFWSNYLDPGIMPPFDPKRDAELIKHLYPEDSGDEIDLTTDNRALVLTEDLQLKQEGAKRLDAEISEIKTELQAKLGSNTYGRLRDGRRLVWKMQHRKAHPVKATSFRAFRIQQPKESA